MQNKLIVYKAAELSTTVQTTTNHHKRSSHQKAKALPLKPIMAAAKLSSKPDLTTTNLLFNT